MISVEDERLPRRLHQFKMISDKNNDEEDERISNLLPLHKLKIISEEDENLNNLLFIFIS